MGDVFLTYSDEGTEYFRRLICCNILFSIMLGLGVVFVLVDIIIVILAILLGGVASLVYVFYFIRKNPPTESEESGY